MFHFRVKTPTSLERTELLSFDWQSVLDQLHKCDSKSSDSFLIVTNKGQDDEYRTKFLTYQEALELVMLALEKKKLRIPLPL